MVQLDICGLQNNVWDLWWCLVMLCNKSLNLEHFKFIRIIELVILFRTFSFTIIVNLSKGCQDFFWYSEVWRIEHKTLNVFTMQCLACLGWPVVDISHNNPSPGQFVVVFTFWMCLHPFYSMFLLSHLCTHFIPMCIF